MNFVKGGMNFVKRECCPYCGVKFYPPHRVWHKCECGGFFRIFVPEGYLAPLDEDVIEEGEV